MCLRRCNSNDSGRPTFDPKTGLYLRRTGAVQGKKVEKNSRVEEEEEEEELSGRKVLPPGRT